MPISDLTLSLVEGMANNPVSPKKLREFHAARLQELRAIAERERRPRNGRFERFLDRITNDQGEP